jgi:hypothetical protein
MKKQKRKSQICHRLLLSGAVQPVVSGVRDALRGVINAGLGGATGCDDAVDHGEAPAVTGVSKLQPGDGAGADGAWVSTLGRRDLLEELGLDEELGRSLVFAGEEGGNGAGIKDVVAQERQSQARDLERGGGREGSGAVGTELGGAIGLERQTAGPQDGCCQGVKVVDSREGRGALARVESGGVVENGESAGGLWLLSSDAGVVLDAVAESDVLEVQAFWRGELNVLRGVSLGDMYGALVGVVTYRHQ